MDDPPEWDEEDLIHEYVNDNDYGEPGPEDMYPDPDDYYEVPAPVPTQVQNPTPAEVLKNDVVREQLPANVSALPPPSEREPLPSKESAVLNSAEDEGDAGPMTGIEIDLYAFERFSKYSKWRTVKTLNGEVESTTVLSTDVGFRDAVRRSREAKSCKELFSTAPEAKLLKFKNGGGRRVNSKAWSKHNVNMHQHCDKSPLVKRSIAGDESVAMTLMNGDRIFISKRDKISSDLNESDNKNREQLLALNMSELLVIAEKIERKKSSSLIRHEMNQIKPDLTDEISVDNKDDDSSTSSNVKTPDTPSKDRSEMYDECKLWVDKHTPTKFSHMLSDERVNREVLRSLRVWDPYVFKKKAPPRPSAYTNYMKRLEEEKTKNGNKSVSSKEKNSNDTRPDPSNRVLLLCGPPGVGKTTLALIAAKHAGYRPIEVNASDERSAGALRERVVNAMESKTLNEKRNDDELLARPNLLILDEVDGADAKTSISVLVEIIRAEIPLKKTSKSKPYLRRPIIFICNHKYSPALRPLLPYAKIFDVNPPTQPRLVARLKSVLNKESSFCEAALLSQLVSNSGGDIRSCLHTLQFSASRYRKSRKSSEKYTDVTNGLISVLNDRDQGIKDSKSDLSAILYTVFKKSKKNPFKRNTNITRDTERVLDIISVSLMD